MRPSKQEWAMRLALETSKRSTCYRRNVGCVLLNNKGHVLSTGYNGTCSGSDHCNEWITSDSGIITHPNLCNGAKSKSGTDLDMCEAIHAEANALLQCKDVYSIHECYCTTAPCVSCIKLLLNTSCSHIYFNEDYPHLKESITLWNKMGRSISQFGIKET